MNKVVLIGNLTKDPELRTTTNGTPTCTITLAVNRRFVSKQTGEREADFISVVLWRQQAELVARYFSKGKKIGIVGSIQTRTYDANDGTKRYVTEVVADEVEFVDSKGSAPSDAPRGVPMPPEPPASLGSTAGFTQVDDDELPF